MKKHVYILKTASHKQPDVPVYEEVFANAEDLLQYLVGRSLKFGLKYPSESIEEICDSVNRRDELPILVTNFFACGRVHRPKDSLTHHVPYLVFKRMIQEPRPVTVDLETLKGVIQ